MLPWEGEINYRYMLDCIANPEQVRNAFEFVFANWVFFGWARNVGSSVF